MGGIRICCLDSFGASVFLLLLLFLIYSSYLSIKSWFLVASLVCQFSQLTTSWSFQQLWLQKVFYLFLQLQWNHSQDLSYSLHPDRIVQLVNSEKCSLCLFEKSPAAQMLLFDSRVYFPWLLSMSHHLDRRCSQAWSSCALRQKWHLHIRKSLVAH